MADYNHVTLVGRPTGEPEIKSIGEDKKRSFFTLAVNRPYKDGNGKHPADFFSVVAWGKLAEVIGEYVKKGENVLIDGRIQSRSYEQDNATKWITEIVAESCSFLSSKKSNCFHKEEKAAEPVAA